MALKYISKLKEKEGKMHGIIQIHNHFKQFLFKNQSPSQFAECWSILKIPNSILFYERISGLINNSTEIY